MADELSLKDALYNILNGLQSEKQWRETGEGFKRLREAFPGVAESVARGAIASVPGSVGDISEFARTVAPDAMNLKFGKERFFPTTREILDYVPRITPTHEGATTLEDVGAAISPGVGGVAKDVVLAGKGLPVGMMMVGPKSKGWLPQMEKAASLMESKNATPDEIRNITGLMRGPEGKWRTEISDLESKVKGKGTFGELHKEKSLASKNDGFVGIGDIFEHPPMEKAYPELFSRGSGQEIEIKTAPKNSRYMGRVENGGQTIAIREDATPDQVRQILNHELQHVIQKKEGFATGGSPDSYTQQADAKIARDALVVRREAERMDDSIPWPERVRQSFKLHNDLGMNLDPQSLKVAEGRIHNPTKDMENVAALYGTDKNIEPASPMRMYEKIAGEAEARLVENRMNLTEEERMQHFPYRFTPKTYDENLNPRPIYGLDVRPEELIVHGHKPGTIDVGGKRLMGMPDEVSPESYDYRGSHQAPGKDDYNAPGHALDKIYPEDIYSSKGHQYYGHGDTGMDKDTMTIMNRARGNPDYPITVYRSVPKEYAGSDINPGDWVTPNLDYAIQHGARLGDYHVLEKEVPAKHIWTDSNSIHEFGYDPTE